MPTDHRLRRWSCLHRGIAMEPERAAKVTGACIVLHNLAMLWKMPVDDLGGEEIEEVPQEEQYRQFQDPEVQEGATARRFITQNHFT
ncbi:hypothetical protein G5714_018039 [Onychostoma macrolepis]|uniref:DDE Tnp4 domain-containing protein n=1 Tax=Onychostoma macrolepis TaxID=369639 RepID=A0A7J6C2U6_9TELE|nr:hypothetical protein G5714_018039 [Onychostoma macrolepis]